MGQRAKIRAGRRVEKQAFDQVPALQEAVTVNRMRRSIMQRVMPLETPPLQFETKRLPEGMADTRSLKEVLNDLTVRCGISTLNAEAGDWAVPA